MEKTKKSNGFKKFLRTLVSLLLMVAIALTSAIIIHNRDSKPASVEVKNGLSAYELAVQYGYDGTLEEWLKTLNGKSAYEIAVENGYSGTEKDWTASLKATAGKDGVSIKTASFSSAGELIIKLSDGTSINLGKAVGIDGKDGTNGKDGVDGTNGIDGIGISSANINEDGQLVLTLSDGTTVNLDKVVGMNGADGVSVTNSVINDNGELVLTYSNGQIANLGVVVGADGKDGADGINGTNGTDGKDGVDGIDGINGIDGKDGISVVKSEINSKGELVLTYSDNTVDNLGVVVGANGKDGTNGTDGKDGINGQNGKDGVNGVSVTNAEINSKGELVLTYSNGQRSNLGNVIGADGKDGVDGVNGQDGKDGVDGINGQDGKDGVNGINGKDGISVIKSEINSKGELVLTYSDSTVANLGVVVGANGKDGKDGINGQDGKDGIDGINGVNGVDGKDGKDGTNGVDGVGIENITINTNGELEITLTSGTTMNLGTIKGADGKDGVDGKDGIDGINGVDGKDGVDGINGTDGQDGKDGLGISSTSINEYGELVLEYTDGTSVNLGTVVGKDGQNGADGKDGINGQDGKDGIDGINGTNGTDGKDGVDGQDGIGVTKTEINEKGELVIYYSDNTSSNLGVVVGADGKDGVNGQDGKDGIDGVNGQDGKDGVNGQDGKDGIGISNVEINTAGELVLTFSDNSTINLGCIVGKDGQDGKDGADGKDGIDGTNGVDGKDGVGIANVTISAEGALTVELTNGTILNLGNIKGENGIGISKSEINANGELVLTYTNGQTANLGVVVGTNGQNGADGKDGVDGTDGKDGQDGVDGRGIENIEIVNGELVVYYSDEPTKAVIIGKVNDDSENGSILEYVSLDDGTYGVRAGSNISTVSEIIIPDTYNGVAITQILDSGFKECNTLEKITFPTTLTTIGRYAFYQCYNLTNIDIPEKVTFIGKCAFKGTSLNTAEIGNANLVPSVTNKMINIVLNSTDIALSSNPGMLPGKVEGFTLSFDSSFTIQSYADEQVILKALPYTYDYHNCSEYDKAIVLSGDITVRWIVDTEKTGVNRYRAFTVTMNWCDYDWVCQ